MSEQVLNVAVCGGLVWHFLTPGSSVSAVKADLMVQGLVGSNDDGSDPLEGVSFVEMALCRVQVEGEEGEVEEHELWVDSGLSYWVSKDLQRFGWTREGSKAIELHNN